MAVTRADKRRRPNIVFILADDMGYGDISAVNGGLSETPNVDGLIRDGMLFANHYSGSTLCAPARACLMTGRYPHRTGVIDTINCNGNAQMHLDEVTLAEVLRDAGYITGLVGKWHLGSSGPYHPHNRGFSESLLLHNHRHWSWSADRNGGPVTETDGRYLADMLTDEAVDFIERNQAEPFFLYLAHFAPHGPREAPEEDIAPFLDKPGISRPVAEIYGMIRRLDTGVGRVLATLDRLGLADDTIVLFSSDNGPQFSGSNPGGPYEQQRFNCGRRGHKDLVYEGGIRVPMVVRWPGRISAGAENGHLTHFADWFPTLAAAAGVDHRSPLGLDGRNIWPELLGAELAEVREPLARSGVNSSEDRELPANPSVDPDGRATDGDLPGAARSNRFWQFSRYVPVSTHNAAIRSGRWKLVRPPVPEIRKFDPRDVRRATEYTEHPERFPDGPPSPVHVPNLPPPLPVELFDIEADPEEQVNLAVDNPDIVTRLSRDLDEWFNDVEGDRLR